MNSIHIYDIEPIIHEINRFTAFVKQVEGNSGDYISFRDSAGYLANEEGYKALTVEKAREALDVGNWVPEWIGTGKIARRASTAINYSANLVYSNQQTSFKNKLNPTHKDFDPNAERVLFDIYRCKSEREAFENAISTFGGSYDLIGFLYYIKDDSRFLPVSPGHFEKSLWLLDIDFKMKRRCDWDNYNDFIEIVEDIRTVINEYMPLQSAARLIDAHSFLWIIQGDYYKNFWENNALPESSPESPVEKEVKIYSSQKSSYSRSEKVKRITKKRANGICQLCGNPAPFINKNGEPYLESHHIIPLRDGGKDSTDNTAALCPNCHRRMHVLKDKADIEKLLSLHK